MLLKDFREQLLFFELIYFRNSFCYRIENSRGFSYKILGHVGLLGKTLIFLSPLGSLKFEDFLSFLFILKLSYSKPFHNTLNYSSAANIEEAFFFGTPGIFKIFIYKIYISINFENHHSDHGFW